MSLIFTSLYATYLWGRNFSYFFPVKTECFLCEYLAVTRSRGAKALSVWLYGLLSFWVGDTKLPKNQHTESKLLTFENLIIGKVSKSAKSWSFRGNFQFQKSSKSFSNFFSCKNTNFGAHFLLLKFFVNISFLKSLYY